MFINWNISCNSDQIGAENQIEYDNLNDKIHFLHWNDSISIQVKNSEYLTEDLKENKKSLYLIF